MEYPVISFRQSRYQSLVGGSEPLQSYLHKRLPENLNSEAALGTVGDVAQCVQWLRSTFLFVRAARDPKRYLNLPQNSPQHLISKKIEELCVRAMNGLASTGLITMDEASCIESTEGGRLMSIFYLDLETMKHIMKIEGTESLERLLWLICESHELADMHLRMDERRCLNTLNRNNTAATIRYPMKGKITTRQMKLNCVIQAILGCLPIPDPSLGQEAMKIMRIADRVCKCLVAYVTRPDLMSHHPQFYSAMLNTLILAKCIAAHLWENSPYLSKQLKGIGPTFSTLLATAGKTNFMLLEESHPRDLERIMNKGPPAGNILRKQISLLPKYQLIITPVDERTISLELILLNHSYLSENMDNLTAGEHHKSYIVVGDSSNHLLLMTSFKDKDLISVYDGTIKHQLKRKHDFEHKVFAHCISLSFVGIDAHAEYSFKDLEHLLPKGHKTSYENIPLKNTTKKQTCITDTFKERKRKNTNDIDITQSKEKRKRDNAVIEKFKSLKETFGYGTKEPKVYRQDIRDKTDNVFNEDVYKPTTLIDMTEENIVPINANNKDLNGVSVHECNVEDNDYDEYIDTAQIDSILNDIEDEISKVRSNTNNSIEKVRANNLHFCNTKKITPVNAKQDSMHLNTKRQSKPITSKTNNYNFIDLLERNLNLSDDEEKNGKPPNHNGFSENIKSHINKYLQKAEHTTKLPDCNIEKLLEDTENTIKNDTILQKDHSETLLTESSKTFDHFSGPGNLYQLKEILESMNPNKQSDESTYYEKDMINIGNKQDEIQIEHKNNDSCNSKGKNEDSNGLHVSHRTDASVLVNQVNDISDSDVDTVRQQVDLESLLTKYTALKHPSEPIYEIKEILKPIEPVRQSIESTHEKDEITDTKVLNNENTGEEKHHVLKSINPCKSIDNSQVFNDRYNRKPVVASDNGATNGISDNQVPELKIASMVNIANQVCQFGSGENTSVQRQNTECLRSGDFYVEDSRTKSIHNNTLPIESNHNYNRHEVNDPSSAEYVNNETVVNTYPSGHVSVLSHNFDEVEECVNNYSFSALKIDTCTKDSIKIVRKIKVDIDISEIISREKAKNESNDLSKGFELFKPSSQHNKQPRNESVNIRNKEIDRINNFTRTQLNTLQYDCISMKRNNELNELISGAEKQDEIKVQKDVNNELNSCYKNDDNIQSKPPEVQYLKQINRESEPVNIETAETKDKKLQNILAKYSKILGKTTASVAPIQMKTNEGSSSYKKSSQIKPNRPFKISDIDRLHAPLPKLLMDDKPAAINVYFPKIEANVETSENKSEELNTQHYDQCNNEDNYINIPEYQYSTLETLNIPIDVDLEPSKDYNIDNSMFDPKTLLQCVVESDSDEIIPPPPQFCDENDMADNFHEMTVSENHNQWCADSENNSCIGHNDTFNESIFEDNFDAELSPSKEIETWTLSHDDQSNGEDSLEMLASNPIKSFTVMRKNPPDDDAFNCSLPRRVRLGKFKFNHKNKFKIRR